MLRGIQFNDALSSEINDFMLLLGMLVFVEIEAYLMGSWTTIACFVDIDAPRV